MTKMFALLKYQQECLFILQFQYARQGAGGQELQRGAEATGFALFYGLTRCLNLDCDSQAHIIFHCRVVRIRPGDPSRELKVIVTTYGKYS